MGFPLFKSRDIQEKRRMEAFMDALPYEYCGWGHDGVTVWSKKFPALFNLPSIQNIRDIQAALLPSDAAALEGMIWRLQRDKEPFTLNVRTHETGKNITLHGLKGTDLDGIETYDVLWAKDTTEDKNQQDELSDNLAKLKTDISEYRAVLDIMPQAIWITNRDNTVEWCNQNYLKLTGQTREAARFHPPTLKALPIEKDRPSYEEISKNALKTNREETLQARVIVDGKRTLTEISILPDKNAKLVIHVIEDITEQEHLRSELKRYVSANTELMEQLSTAISIFGPQQNLEFYNPSFAALWGLEERWLDKQPGLGDVLEKLRENRRLPEQADFRNYKKGWLDLFTTLLESEQSMMHLPDGKAIRAVTAPHPMGGLMITFEDVTSRLELESSYNTLIAVQKETLDNLTEGVAVFGSDARLKLCNPSYLSLWKLNPEDIEGEPHISHIVEKKKKFFKSSSKTWDKVKSQLMAHAIERRENKETLRRGDNKTIELTSVPLPDGGVMVTYRDITDSMRIQEVLEEKNKALQEAENLKTDFLAKVSYQLRTPLNAISGFSEILNAEYFGTINEKQREYTHGIMDATSRLSNLINDILDLSSIEGGYLRLDKTPIDLVDMVTDIHELTRDWAGMDNIKTVLDIQTVEPRTLVLDEKRIKQALLNIIRNAINYTPEDGMIKIGMYQGETNICITVTDTGPGITESDKDNLFKPFNGDDDKASSGTGTGLGLTLAHNIIELHKGNINIRNQNGKGTEVTICLPIKS